MTDRCWPILKNYSNFHCCDWSEAWANDEGGVEMMGQQAGAQDQLFYSFNLEAHVPSDHLLRGIDWFLDLMIPEQEPAEQPKPQADRLKPYRQDSGASLEYL
jgi:hypothetical protein